MLNINGIAHIALSVKDISESKMFYNQLLPFLGLNKVHEGKKSIYHVGARTGIMIQEIDHESKSSTFNQNNIGLHHFCFRARNKRDIDLINDKLIDMKAKIIRGPLNGNPEIATAADAAKKERISGSTFLSEDMTVQMT